MQVTVKRKEARFSGKTKMCVAVFLFSFLIYKNNTITAGLGRCYSE